MQPAILAPIRIVAIAGQPFVFPIAVPEGFKIYSQHDCKWLKKDLTGTPDADSEDSISLILTAKKDDVELKHHATIVVRKSFEKRAEYKLTIDSIANGNESLAAKVELPPGDYVAVISDCCAHANGKYGSLPTILHDDGKTKLKTLSYGVFPSLTDARDAYIGLAYTFSHTGGVVSGYFTSFFAQDAYGSIEVKLIAKGDGGQHLLIRYEALGKIANSIVLEIDNQDYIIFRHKSNWIGWPTFDRATPISFNRPEYKCKLNPVMSLAMRNKTLRGAIFKSSVSRDDLLAISDAIYFLEL